MAIIGAFIGGLDSPLAAGTFAVSLKGQTTDRLNMDTMSWTITCTTGTFNSWLPGESTATSGSSRTVSGDLDGSAVIILEAGKRYTFVLNHSGNYQNDGDLCISGESQQQFGLLWDLFTYPELTTQLDVETLQATVTATKDGVTMTATAVNGVATFMGIPTGTWTITAGNSTTTIVIEHLYQKIELANDKIYGMKISLSASDPTSMIEYTDYAVGITPASGTSLGGWANVDWVKEIRPVVLSGNGSSKTYLNLRDLTKTITGAASNISTAGNDAMVEIPTLWVSVSSDSSYVYVKVAAKQVDNTYQAYAHLQNGVVQAHTYIGCFCGYVSSSKLYSQSGTSPTVSTSITNFIAYAKARGTGFDIFTWHQLTLLKILFLLFYKTTNCQTALGQGYVGGSAKQTSAILSYTNDFGLYGSTSTTTRMSFLWVNDLWGNVYQFVGRAKTNSSHQMMTIVDGYSSVTDSDFETISTSPTSSRSGYISAIDTTNLKSLFFPKTCSGSSTTYWCDYGYVSASFFPYVGGYWANGDSAGLFYAYFYYSASNTDSYIGSRLSYCLNVA